MISSSKSIEACASYYGSESDSVKNYLIEARKQRFPMEDPYRYLPFQKTGRSFQWNENSRKDLIDYNLDDLSI